MPFPRGYLRNAAQIRLESAAGDEIAVDSAELLRWHHLTDTKIDMQSIRSVLLSFHHDCIADKAVPLRLQWGGVPGRPAKLGVAPVSVALRTWVNQAAPLASEHTATDNYSRDTKAAPIKEPAAWVALPTEWLLSLNVRGPSVGIRNAHERENWIGFAKTYVNDVDSSVVTYKNDKGTGLIDWSNEFEGWLYDRPMTLWGVYFGTGDVAWLRHAHRASRYYANWIASDDSHAPKLRGSFLKKPAEYPNDPGDPKYSLAGGLLADYLFTGDQSLLTTIRSIADYAGTHISTRLLPANKTDGLWTERQVSVALAAALYAFEATGDPKYRRRAQEIVAGFRDDVRTPPPGYPPMHGVLLHRPEVHEGDQYPDWIVSPWMSALLAETLWHYYLNSGDMTALQLIGDYAQFMVQFALYSDKKDPHLFRYWYPYYIAGLKSGHTDNGPNDDKEHAYDLLGLLVRGRWARRTLGQPTEAIDRQIKNLAKTAQFNFADWIRDTPGLPRYRLAPTRKFAWWYGSTYDLDWLISQH